MLVLIAIITINTPFIVAWDSDQMEVFDLVEEMNNINFYKFLEVSEVSIFCFFEQILYFYNLNYLNYLLKYFINYYMSIT